MFRLIQKGVRFEWAKVSKEAFERLKKLLTPKYKCLLDMGSLVGFFVNLREGVKISRRALQAKTSSSSSFEERMKRGLPTKRKIANVKHVIAVASGKGGVGKSTTAVNLALAIASTFHYKVGILDADLFGPSIPKLMNLKGQPGLTPDDKLIPLVNYGVKAMSMGFLADESSPIVWRGLMVTLQQFLYQVHWDGLDLLVIDMPPGTGDTQLTITQQIELDGVVIISTPQDLALLDVRKAINMFKKVNVPILGTIQNMSMFICPNCNHKTHIFGNNGVVKLSKELNVEMLGEIPLDYEICDSSDKGNPVVLFPKKIDNNFIRKSYVDISKKIINKIVDK
ncbi:9597_t:CDS:2 [Entrophospora sp. SA101]|nr:9597_t:CDS:2 [Entrophospora sp. SA101]CAJ0923005.1 14659_t:CDS:2 [Entrophospora sp. SA101]CAJ0923017.1 14664_t:CDS:2 [Entrophospora sp. SA101]